MEVNNTKEQKTDELVAKILQILSWQQVITNQGANYTGEKDWALNQILNLISQEREKWIAEKVKQLTPPESWKQCLKIGTGQDEMCMMCGFNPKELINLLQNK